MTFQPGSEREQRSPETHQGPSPSEDELVEYQREESDAGDATDEQQQHPREEKQARSTSPAYVAPIPKIGPIAPVPPSIQISPASRPQLPQYIGSFLVGKTVNEYGEIVDENTGQVLARADGDLPSMVGRTVSSRQGDILGDNGELLGYVADVEIGRKAGGSASARLPHMSAWPPMTSLTEIMGRSNASLMVDHLGNILDMNGNVVGKFHDNNNPMHRKEREGQQRQKETASTSKRPESPLEPCPAPPTAAENEPEEPPQERQQNAQSWRKENESPSDIFLDVKSTTEGIQLTIRIPTVFNGSQVRPTVQFS